MNLSKFSSQCVLATTLMLSISVARAGSDHGPGDTTQISSLDIPKRQASGNLFIPKPAQRQLKVETEQVMPGEFPKTLDLAGKVIMDPNYGGKVQAIVAGRITPGPNGFPLPGQKVKQGEVLAYVTPEAGPSGSRSLAESRLKRYRELADTIPRKTLEEAQAAVANEELRAPVAGVISTMGVVSGQVVEPRQLIFEVVNPNRLLVEALAYDGKILKDIAGGYIAYDGKTIQLNYLGGGQSLREQALPITFSGKSEELIGIPVGQPLRVFVSTSTQTKGLKIPLSAIVKNAANQNTVWVKGSPEEFEPRVVLYEPLDGKYVIVTSGLTDKDRVVTNSASLINQIR
ncbi:efflux RND transporter periplasmic adaptor subunit [Polynucleobacter victoriensis]|uniref:Multidrug efflux pump subunit AcrA (Membrane-fusion protein) n=1 Tax=Polynucleobacter victoriensis TaxID=2049319 RepID=A0A212T6X6_9BURK|nr:HlyD family efflux transporter periplasmic adaptor subunit [Polynucleobacter victoriensis]SNC61813.1 Multidrug efflux pump subunit AcrA (membrane-fusion protein) [Polynucleobacter victoriensis]